MSFEISDEELIVFEEISRLSLGEYRNVFGHTLPSTISFLPLSSQEVLDIMKKVIEAKDESLWDQIFPPLPDDCYS